MQFMFDEHEIVCWINFIDRFNLFSFVYDINNPQQVLDAAFTNIVYIGGATKSILNDNEELKNEILSNVFGPAGMQEYNKFISSPHTGAMFD